MTDPVGGDAAGGESIAADPMRRWLDAAEGTALDDVWPGVSLDESFAAFYSATMKHTRVDHEEGLRAIARVSVRDRRRLSAIDRVRLVRLRAHAYLGAGQARKANTDYARAWRAFERIGAKFELARTGIGWVATLGQLSEYRAATDLARRVNAAIPKGDNLPRARLVSNLAIIMRQSGRGDAAIRQFRAARRHFRKADFRTDAAFVTYNIALAFLESGHWKQAAREFRDAEEHFRKHGIRMLHLHCRAGLAFVELLAGDLRTALDTLDEVMAELREAGDPRFLALVQRQQAEFLAAVGALERAERAAAESYHGYRGLGLRTDAAHAALLHGRILAALGRFVDARVRLDDARVTWRKTGNHRFRRRTEVELANVLLSRGDRDDATRLLKDASPYLRRHDRAIGSVRCRHLLAECHAQAGRGGLAARLARDAYRDANRLPARLERPWIALTVARAYSSVNRDTEALRWVRRSVDELERIYLRLGSYAMRGQVSASRESVYRGVVEVVLSSEHPKAARHALDLLSRAQSPQLIEDLLQGGSGLSAGLRTAIARLRDDLLGTTQPGRDEVRFTSLRRRIDDLDDSLGRTLGHSATLVKRALAARGFAAWSQQLAGRTLVHFDRRGTEWAAFVVEPSRVVRYVELPGAHEAMQGAWLGMRMLLEQAAHLPPRRRARFLAATEEESHAVLAALRDALWTPLGVNAGEVLTVPIGDLQAIPLEALPTGDECIVSRWPHPAIVHQGDGARVRNALLLHDRTADRRREVEGVGQVLRRRGYRVRTGHRRADVERAEGRLGVLHVAAHGNFHRPRWLLNGIRLSDGWLGFEHLRRSQVRNSLVYFGSCESGLRTEHPGAEFDGWLSTGMAAGARELVVALWKIDDEAARAFASSFYAHWSEGLKAPWAAARARAEVREKLPHPFSWAPFAVTG